jgi:hypothetical protein
VKEFIGNVRHHSRKPKESRQFRAASVKRDAIPRTEFLDSLEPSSKAVAFVFQRAAEFG